MSIRTNSKTTPKYLAIPKSRPVVNETIGGGFMGDVQKINEFQVELTKYQAEVDAALAHCRSILIDSTEGAEDNVAFAGSMRKLSKKIEATKKEITAPAREFTAKVNALASGYTEKLDEAIGIISSKVGAFNHAQAEAQREEMELLAIIEETSGIKTDYSVAPVKEVTKTAMATTYQTTEFDIEVTDLSLVPIQFLMLDESMVKAAIKSGRRDIPGVKITEQKVTHIRTK